MLLLVLGFAKHLCRWEGYPIYRNRATPHMKCYFKYSIVENPLTVDAKSQVELDWFCLTSQNLSQAAWGVLQSGGTKLYIKSYELGVLFIKEKIRSTRRSFSCTPDHPIMGLDVEDSFKSGVFDESRNSYARLGITNIDIPFIVPPPRYHFKDDVPWTWDSVHLLPDVFGRIYRP